MSSKYSFIPEFSHIFKSYSPTCYKLEFRIIYFRYMREKHAQNGRGYVRVRIYEYRQIQNNDCRGTETFFVHEEREC